MWHQVQFVYGKRILLPLVLISVIGCLPAGQRLLSVEIELNGQVVFEGIRGVPDSTPRIEMWDILPDTPLRATDDASELIRDEQTTLADAVVRISHVESTLLSANVESLQLVASDQQTWRISAANADQIRAIPVPAFRCQAWTSPRHH